MCPFAERHDQDGPLCQHGEVHKENPFVGFQDVDIDEHADHKGGKAHQEQPDHEEPVRRLGLFGNSFVLLDAVTDEVEGHDENDAAQHVSEDVYEQIFGVEPVQEHGSEEQRQVRQHQHEMFEPAELVVVAA